MPWWRRHKHGAISLKVLMTNNTLDERGGIELYIRDLAMSLRNRGHDVVGYSTRLGSVAEEMRSVGIPVVNDLADVVEMPDVIHGHHHLDASAAALYFPKTPVVYACHGWAPWQEAPLTYPLAARYVAVSELTRKRLTTFSIPPEIISVIPNFVSLQRFLSKRSPDRPIQRVLAYGNAWTPDSATLALVRKSCQKRGLEFKAIGEGMGNYCPAPHDLLPTFDLVFAMGRSALEAMACGCVVAIADQAQIGGLVTMDSFARHRDDNFGFAVVAGKPVTAPAVEQVFDALSLKDAASVTQLVRDTMNLETVVALWEQQYSMAVSTGPTPLAEVEVGLSKPVERLKQTISQQDTVIHATTAHSKLFERELVHSKSLLNAEHESHQKSPIQIEEIAQLKKDNIYQAEEIDRLNKYIIFKKEEISNLKNEIETRTNEHAQSQLQLAQRDSQLADQVRLTTEAENRLNKFTQGLTWRVALRLRKAVPKHLVRVVHQLNRRVSRSSPPSRDVVLPFPSMPNVVLRPEWFDESYYRLQEPPLADTSIDAFTHFATVGWREGRNPHPLFDVNWYVSQNPDLATGTADPLHHFLAHAGPVEDSFGWNPFSSGEQPIVPTHLAGPYKPPGRRPFISFDEADVLRRINAAQVLSLDIFDTALVRRVSPPIAVFELMEVAARQLDARFRGLARQRVSAESKARELAAVTSGTPEIDFEAIYDVLARDLGLSESERRQLQDIELDAERSVLRANPEVLSWYNTALQQGKKTIFVSDMYHSSAFLAEVLESVGFSNPTVFVSNECGAGKWQTVMFERISAKLDIAPHDIFHIGDNQQADYYCAQQAGWTAMHYVEGGSRHPYALQLSDGLAPDPSNLAVSVGLGLARERRLRLEGMTIDEEERSARQIGYEVVGPTVLALAGWAAAKAKTERLDRVLFLARDGYLLQKVYEQLRQHGYPACESRYVLASRRLLYSRMFTSHESVHAAVEKIHFAPSTSLVEYLDIFLLPDELVTTCAHKLGVFDVHAPLLEQMRGRGDYPSIKKQIADAIEAMIPIILKNAKEHKSQLEEYYREAAGLDDESRVGLVDLGWSGSIIHPIEDALRSSAPNITISSYFFGLLRNARNHLNPDMLVNAYFFRDCEWSIPNPLSPLSGLSPCDIISASPSLVEVLISENTTTAINVGRDTRSGAFNAIRADDSYGPRQRHLLELVHRAALNFAEDAIAMLPSDPKQWNFQPLLSAVWTRLLSSPDEVEARWLGSFPHRIDASGRAANTTLVTSGNTDPLASFRASLWPAGTLALMNPVDRAKVLNEAETK